VAIGADHVVQGVSGTADVGAAQSFRVAPETIVQNLLGLELRKRHDGRFAAARLDMSFTGPMTALASGAFGRFFAGGDAFVVRILVKTGPNVGVAGAAYVTADEAGRRGWLLLSVEQQRAEQEY
jgi:hypothetical protein